MNFRYGVAEMAGCVGAGNGDKSVIHNNLRPLQADRRKAVGANGRQIIDPGCQSRLGFAGGE